MAISFDQQAPLQKTKKFSFPFRGFFIFIFVFVLGFVLYTIISALPSEEDIVAKGTTMKDLKSIEKEMKVMNGSMFRSLRQVNSQQFLLPPKNKRGRDNPFESK